MADSATNASSQKRNVALVSVLAAILLTSLKLVVGLSTGSLGILSEAAHSGLDLVAALMTFFAVRLADQPADESHQFGHGKVENFSALFETLLLFVTCIWIISEAVQRLFFRAVTVEASAWSFIIMGISIAVDFTRSRALMRVAKAHNSQALEADALHFSTDLWSSSVVIVGLAMLRVGEAFGIAWLQRADAISALIVAMIVVYISVQLGGRSIRVLLDAAPSELAQQIRQGLRGIPGVREIRKLRARQAGAQTFVDATIAVMDGISLEDGHRVANRVEDVVRRLAPGADVMVHVEALHAEPQDLGALVRATAAAHGIHVHGLRSLQNGKLLNLDLHVEVDASLTLQDAHAAVTAFEQDLRKASARSLEIVSHIEPVVRRLTPIQSTSVQEEKRVRQAVTEILARVCGPQSAHHIRLLPAGNGRRDLSLHCYVSGGMSVVSAHELSEEVERQIRDHLPDLDKIIVHVEPTEERP
jgi:cation diffusion facilitator family transporter